MMTTDQQRAILEAAAKACGITGTFDDGICWFKHRDTGLLAPWTPLTNPADTASMCAKLEIDTVWFNGFHVTCGDDRTGRHSAQPQDHDNSSLKAWMFAATMVAAKIGDLK